LFSMNMALLNISKNADIFPQCALFVSINHDSDNRIEHFLKFIRFIRFISKILSYKKIIKNTYLK